MKTLDDESSLPKKRVDYVEWLSRIDDLLNDEEYEYAFDTLTGIYDWVQEKKFITENQKQAVRNISDAPSSLDGF